MLETSHSERTVKSPAVDAAPRPKAGRNQLLIKIQNVTGDWSFLYRLRVRGR